MSERKMTAEELDKYNESEKIAIEYVSFEGDPYRRRKCANAIDDLIKAYTAPLTAEVERLRERNAELEQCPLVAPNDLRWFAQLSALVNIQLESPCPTWDFIRTHFEQVPEVVKSGIARAKAALDEKGKEGV